MVLLLNKGANVNVQGGRYSNALQVALFRGYQEIVALLQNNSVIILSNRPGSRALSNPVKKLRLPDPKPADYPAPEDIN